MSKNLVSILYAASFAILLNFNGAYASGCEGELLAPKNESHGDVSAIREKYKGLSISEAMAYDQLLSLEKGKHYNILRSHKLDAPMKGQFRELVDTMDSSGKRYITATFLIFNIASDLLTSVINIPIHRVVSSRGDPYAGTYYFSI